MIVSRTHLTRIAGLLLAGALGAAACASPATQAPAAATAVPAATTQALVAATQAPAATTAPTAATTQVTLQLAQNGDLGKFLADDSGMTLYLYTKDAPDTSNCYDKCAQAWPPLLAAGQPTLNDGLDSSLIGTTQRKDGSTQLTYNKWPLYHFDKDKKPGDTAGQTVGKVWWVVSGEGNPIKPAALQVAQNDKLGKFLADGNGRALYLFTKDTKNTTNCYGKCESFWPPLLTVGQPALTTGLDTALLGVTVRKDGSSQVTYNGWPLYYYDKDVLPGDVNGQGSQNVWYVIAPDGQTVK